MKRKHIILMGIAVAAALMPACGHANDSTAMLGAGGLELVKNDSVRLAREDLYLSPSEVRVRYEFVNGTKADFESEVAFPLPDVDLSELSEVGIVNPGKDPVNFVDFSVVADGRPVAFSGEMKAMLDGRDITALLARHGIPVSRFDEKFYDALDNVPGPARKELADAGVALWDDYGNTYPKWTMRTAYHWRQVFPAGKTVVIEHRYKPVLGLSFFSEYDLEAMHAPPEEGEEGNWVVGKEYCVDAATEAAIRRKLSRVGEDQYHTLSALTLRYILTTANNWSGPIGHFRMEIDKEKPGRILSLCMDGLKKESPALFIYEKDGFVPEKEVDLLFLDELRE